jgi:hypothetical protein
MAIGKDWVIAGSHRLSRNGPLRHFVLGIKLLTPNTEVRLKP